MSYRATWTIAYSTLLHSTKVWYTILYYTILYSSLVDNTLVCYTLLCTLLYSTLRYLTSPGVTASEGAIDIINAFQEIMFKCSKMLYNFASGITYKLYCNAHLGLVSVSVRALRCKHCVRTKHTIFINISNH